VELVSRAGPYLVTDVDVEAWDAKAWKLVKSVRGAGKRVIAATVDPPVRTARVRVKILRELYQGKDRQYADVEAVRIFDTSGRERAANRAVSIPLTDVAPDLKRALPPGAAAFPAMAVEVQPTTAETIARLDEAHRRPAILRNRFGRGEAILLTTSEASFRRRDPFWAALGALTAGEPTVSCAAAARYRIVLTRIPDAHVLHVIDRHAGRATAKAGNVTISLRTERLGGPKQARPIDPKTLLKTTRSEGVLTLELRPDPVASIVLR